MAKAIKDYAAAIALACSKARADKGWTQIQVCMATGIPQTTLSKLERQGAPLTFTTAYRLAHVYGVAIHELMPLKQSPDVVAELEAVKAELVA